MTFYENSPDNVFLCENCDAEFTVTKIDDEEAEVCFCPYCGEPFDDLDEEYDEEEDEDEQFDD